MPKSTEEDEPTEFTRLRIAAGFAHARDAAEAMGYSEVQWRKFEKGKQSPPTPIVLLLRKMAKEGGLTRSVPILGELPAGPPDLREEHLGGYVEVETSLLPSTAEAFAVYARGQSMERARIFDGDLLVAIKDPDVHVGQVVVATVDGDPTVKRYRQARGGAPFLEGDQGKIYPRAPEGLVVIGPVVMLFRRFEALQ